MNLKAALPQRAKTQNGNAAFLLVHQEGFEPSTFSFGVKHSIP